MKPRRSRNDTPEPPAADTPAPDEGAEVATATITTPRSKTSIDRQLAALRDADSGAKDRDEKRGNALTDADRLDQAVAGMDQRENELRVELDQIQRDREAATKRAHDARVYAQRMEAERDEFTNQAADAADVLSGWGVTVDPNLLVPTSPATAAMPTVVDPTALTPEEAARLDGALSRIDAAHAELPSQHREEEGL